MHRITAVARNAVYIACILDNADSVKIRETGDISVIGIAPLCVMTGKQLTEETRTYQC